MPHRLAQIVTVSDVIAQVAKNGNPATASRELLKKAGRAIGVATSPLRPPPDFLIIGAKRGGTTSFYYDLLEHPAVVRLFPGPLPLLKRDATKGAHYFDTNYPRGERWYRSYFPTSARRAIATRRHGIPAIAGEASPFYLFHPAAASRAHACVPEARIIALLRDPVMRTYSHWKERRRNSAEELEFLDALDAEDARLSGERERLLTDPAYVSYPWEQQSYFTQSLYVESLRPWVDFFGRDRVFVAASEDYYTEPGRVLGDVHEFLGLPRRATRIGSARNAAQGGPLDPTLVHELRSRFAQPNQELGDLLGQSFPWLGVA